MSKIDQLKNNIGFRFSPIRGSIADSVSGNLATITNSTGVYWKQTPKGYGLFFTTGTVGRITFSATSGNTITENSWIIMQGDFTETVNGHLLCKRDGGGTSYNFSADSATNRLYFYDGTRNNYVTGLSFKGVKQLAIKVIDGQKSQLFVNGIYFADFNDITTVTENDAPLVIGNYYSGSAYGAGSVFHEVIVLNDLTGIDNEDVTELLTELMDERGFGRPKTDNFRYYQEVDTNSKCVFQLDGKINNGVIADLQSSGLYGVPGAGVINGRNVYVNALKYTNITGAYTDIANGFTTLLSGNQDAALSFIYTPGGTYENVLFTNSNGTFFMNISSATNIYLKVGANTRTYTISALVPGVRYKFYFEKDGSGDNGNLYINNELQSSYSGTLADMPTVASSLLRVGAYTSGFETDGFIEDFKVYNAALTSAERTADYIKTSQHVLLNVDAEKYLPTVADISSGKVSNTDWEIYSGVWRIRQDPQEDGENILIDGDMEASGTTNYTAQTNATISKDTTTVHEGTQSMKLVTTAANVGFYQSPMIIGKRYKISGWAKGDGSGAPRITAASLNAIYATSTDWQYFEVYTDPTPSSIIYFLYTGSGTCYWDDIKVEEIGGGKKWLEYSTGGGTYIKGRGLRNKTFVFDTIKLKDATNYVFQFASEATYYGHPTASSYFFYYGTTETISFWKRTGGSNTSLVTLTGKVTVGKQHKAAISVSDDGVFNFYMLGGDWTTWTHIGTFTDTSFDDSIAKYINNSGESLGDLYVFDGVLDPTNGELPI